MFENRSDPLASRSEFLWRVTRHFGLSVALVIASLFLGASGYRSTEGMGWLDATLNASMILTGMGPVNDLHTSGGKVFAIGYSLFAGLVVLTASALVLAPVVHRMMHALHLDEDDETGQGG